MDELKTKVEEHKQTQAKKMTRRGKWENWQKTQAMFYKKTSTNYKKWDMYESNSEDSEEKEPIVPHDDPTFKAMEQDFENRAKERRVQRVLAESFKEKGNQCMKQGLYKTANKHYTDALEAKKDFLVGYANRALVRLKLELWLDAIDDCTRVLEYTEVFHGSVESNPDLCYKCYIRRAQAHRGLKDFDEAINDLSLAAKLLPKETDPERLRKLYEEDKELNTKIVKIMANAESLKGKEYIDFLLDFLTGKTHKAELKPGVRVPKFCANELKSEEAKKLLEILKPSDELLYYFNAKDGFKTLVDSLYHGFEALVVLDALLIPNNKLREDFQR